MNTYRHRNSGSSCFSVPQFQSKPMGEESTFHYLLLTKSESRVPFSTLNIFSIYVISAQAAQ